MGAFSSGSLVPREAKTDPPALVFHPSHNLLGNSGWWWQQRGQQWWRLSSPQLQVGAGHLGWQREACLPQLWHLSDVYGTSNAAGRMLALCPVLVWYKTHPFSHLCIISHKQQLHILRSLQSIPSHLQQQQQKLFPQYPPRNPLQNIHTGYFSLFFFFFLHWPFTPPHQGPQDAIWFRANSITSQL